MKKGIILLLAIVFAVSLFASTDLLQYGTSNVTRNEKNKHGSYSARRDVLLEQLPNQVNGLFCDGSFVQVIAENFVLSADMTIEGLVIWGGNYPNNIPMDPDYLTVAFHTDAAGAIGTMISTEVDVPYTKDLTGTQLFGVDEWMYTLTLATPVDLVAGTYWVEFYNTTGGPYPTVDTFFWETGDVDPVNGIVGSAWATTAPGSGWTYDGATDLSIQIIGSAGGGDDYVEIGDGTGYGAYPAYYADWANYWENARTQTLYLASELGGEKILTDLSYNFERIAAAPDNWLANVTIKILPTTDDALVEGAFYDMAGATTVWSNANYVPATATGWNDLIDITDYEYDGVDNLIVEILWGDNGYYESPYFRSFRTTGAVTRVLLGYADSETPPNYDAASTDFSNIRFYYDDVIPGPEGDTCETAIITGEVIDLPFDTSLASPSVFGGGYITSPDLWFEFTAPSDGTAYFGVCDSGFDTYIALWGECDPATLIAENDDSCGLQSELFDIAMVSGEDYYLQVGGFSSSNGPGVLDIIFTSSGQPIIGVTPMSISETLEPEDVVVVPVTIENTGTTDLTFDITVVETSVFAGVPAANHLSPVYDPANAESDPMIVELENPNVSDALFDLQFQYDCYDAGGEAGIETDGNFIYVPLWNGSDYLRYNMDGTFVEYFTVAGTASVRDLAYDGQYFYGAAANNSLFEMDFTPGAEVLVSTITAPVSCRAIAYDDGADGFWANNWSDTITLFDRSGTTLNTLTMSATYISYYGFAYDDFSDGGPYLWGFSQSVAGGILVQYDIAAGVETGVVFDVGTLVGSVGSAGGMFIADGIVPGFTTIGCMVQNEFIVGLELTAGDEPWITVTPLTGTVVPGASVIVDVTLSAEDLNNITKTANIEIANNAGDDVIVDVTMIVEEIIPTWDPPSNVAVDDYEGIVTWSAPAVGGVITEDNFDSYTAGDYIAVVGDDWTTWSNAPGGAEDALVTDVEASSPSNSVVVELNQDLVLIMDDYTSGIYTYEMKMFVPTGYCGYFNIQKTNVPGTEWAFQIYFQTDGTALADANGAGALTYAFNHDEWMDLKIVIDLDTDWAIFYHDGVEMIGYQYSLGCFGAGALLSFGGVNIFGGANSGGPGDTPMFYFDDVILSEGAVATRDLTGYNVYLDDMVDPIATVGDDEFTFTYSDLVFDQDYVAGVSAVYDDGESEIIEVEFTYTGLDAGNVIIAATKLNGNYPNPFNPVTNIAYSIKEAGNVTIEVYNIKGQLVKTLVNDVRETGNYTVAWNGRDNSNKSVASGVYFYKMKAQNYNNTKKMILMK